MQEIYTDIDEFNNSILEFLKKQFIGYKNNKNYLKLVIANK